MAKKVLARTERAHRKSGSYNVKGAGPSWRPLMIAL